MNDDLDKLYNAVSSRFDIGDLETFRTRMQQPEDRRRFYDAVYSRGFDLGDYDTYESRLSSTETITPKEPVVEEQPIQEVEQPAQPVVEEPKEEPKEYNWFTKPRQTMAMKLGTSFLNTAVNQLPAELKTHEVMAASDRMRQIESIIEGKDDDDIAVMNVPIPNPSPYALPQAHERKMTVKEWKAEMAKIGESISEQIPEIESLKASAAALQDPDMKLSDGVNLWEIADLIGAQLPRIGASAILPLLGSFVQLNGGIGYDVIKETAAKKYGVKTEDVEPEQMAAALADGDVDTNLSKASAAAAASLDMIGLKALGNSLKPLLTSTTKAIAKEAVSKGGGEATVKALTKAFAKKMITPTVEGATEAGQSVIQQGAANIAADREYFDLDWDQIREEGLAGFGLGLLTMGLGSAKMSQAQVQRALEAKERGVLRQAAREGKLNTERLTDEQRAAIGGESGVSNERGETTQVNAVDESAESTVQDTSGETESTADISDESEAQAEGKAIGWQQNKRAVYQGKPGVIYNDGVKAEFEADDGTIYELGPLDDIGSKKTSELGIELDDKQTVETAGDGNFTVRDNQYTTNNYSDPTQAINYDEEGNPISVTLDLVREDGTFEKRTFRGNDGEQIIYDIQMAQVNPEQVEQYIQENEEARREIEAIDAAVQRATAKVKEQDTKGDNSTKEGEVNELQSDVQRSKETGTVDGEQPSTDGTINEGSTTDEMSDESNSTEATGDTRQIGGKNNSTLDEGRIATFENEDGTMMDPKDAEAKFLKIFDKETEEDRTDLKDRKIERAVSDNKLTNALSWVDKIFAKGLRKADRVGSNTIGKGIQWVEDGVKRTLKKWQTSEKEALGQVADMTRGVIANSTRSDAQQTGRRKFQGRKNDAHEKVFRLNRALHKAFADDPKSLERVHKVLDPEYFDKGDPDVDSAGDQEMVDPEISFDDLTDKEKEAFYTLRNLNNYTHYLNYEAGLIDEETYNEFKGQYIHRAYKEFEQRDPSVDEYLGEMFEGKMKGAIYKKRTYDPKTGEEYHIEDPIYLTMKTLSQTMQNVAVKEYADKMYDDLSKSGLVLTPQEYKDSKAKNRYRKLDGFGKFKPYGKLTNMYVPNQIAEDFKGFSFNNKVLRGALDFFDGYDRHWFRQLGKKGLTTYLPITRAVNIIGGFWFSYHAGIPHFTFLTNRVKAKEDLDAYGDISRMLMAEGILSKSAGHVEFKNTLSAMIKSLETVGIKVDKEKAKKRFKRINQLDEWAVESYGRTDDVAKVAAYISLKEMGVEHNEAIERISEGFQNYATVGKAWSISAKTPLVGKAFGRFIADIMRIRYNNIKNRPITTLSYLGVSAAMAHMFSEMAGEDDTTEEVRTSRDFIPKQLGIDELSLMWQVPGVGEVNMAKYVTPFYTYDMGEFSNGMMEETTKWLPYQLKTREGSMIPIPVSNDPSLGYMRDLWVDRDFRDKSIRNPDGIPLTDAEMRNNEIVYAMRNGIPLRFGTFAHDMYLAVNGMEDYYGRNRDLSQALLSRVIKVQDFGNDEAKQLLERKLDFIDIKIDKLNQDIGKRQKARAKEIKRINNKDIRQWQKDKQIKAEEETAARFVVKAKEKINDLNAQKVQPKELLTNIPD